MIPPAVATVYDKPLIYLLIHVGLGIVSAVTSVSWLVGAFLMYQGFQLLIGRRFFFFEGDLKSGNSIAHTAVKLGEFFIGYAIGSGIRIWHDG